MRRIKDVMECVDPVELKIPCKSEYVRTVRWLVRELAEDAFLPPEAIDEVQIAACEAVANIVRHAYGPEKAPQPIFLRFCRGPGQFSIEIIDRGIGFRVPKPDPNQEPDLSREGGLGIVLIRALMDRVEYWSRPNTGTRIRMTKSLSPAPADEGQAKTPVKTPGDGGVATISPPRTRSRRRAPTNTH